MRTSSSSIDRYAFPALSLLASSFLPSAWALGNQDHFILTEVASLAYARMDPIVNPGEVSGHLHNIMGGSCFNLSLNTPEQQQACKCSTAIVGADKSNYWAPNIFYQHQNGSFQPIPNQNRIYYFMKSDDVKPFPPGLRMISGLSVNRDESDTRSLGLNLSCDEGTPGQWMANGTSHPNGCGVMQAGIYFPSCGWANQSLDSHDHFSHMAWAQQTNGTDMIDWVNGASCPESHPIKYPTIFMQANYYLDASQPWYDGNPLILSTGDTTGLAYHADFVNGWDQQTLSDTIEQCGLGHAPGDQLSDCPPLAKTADQTWECRYENQIPDEDVGLIRPLKALPGCNPVWDLAAGPNKPMCDNFTNPGMVWPTVEYVDTYWHDNIPITFTGVPDVSNLTQLRAFRTSMQAAHPGWTTLLPWGSDTQYDDPSDLDALHAGTASDIIDNLVDNADPGYQYGGDSKSSSSSSTSSIATSDSEATTASDSQSTSTAAAKATSPAGAKAVTPESSKTSDSTSTATESTLPSDGVALAAPSPSESSSSDESGKTCSKPKKKRNLKSRSKQIRDGKKGHVTRKVRRSKIRT